MTVTSRNETVQNGSGFFTVQIEQRAYARVGRRPGFVREKKDARMNERHEVIIKAGTARARNASAIDGGASMAAPVHCKLDGVLPYRTLSSDYPICPSG